MPQNNKITRQEKGVTLTFPLALWVRLTTLAARQQTSKKNVIVEAIRQYLDREKAA